MNQPQNCTCEYTKIMFCPVHGHWLTGDAVESAAEDRLEDLERINLQLRKRIHNSERHNQHFERCESGWCNPDAKTHPARDLPVLGDFAALDTARSEQSSIVQAKGLDLRDRIACLMIAHGFTTGHGDTVEDLLGEFDSQLKEPRAGAEEARKDMVSLKTLEGFLKRPDIWRPNYSTTGDFYISDIYGRVHGYGKTLGEAIDAAIAPTGKEKQ